VHTVRKTIVGWSLEIKTPEAGLCRPTIPALCIKRMVENMERVGRGKFVGTSPGAAYAVEPSVFRESWALLGLVGHSPSHFYERSVWSRPLVGNCGWSGISCGNESGWRLVEKAWLSVHFSAASRRFNVSRSK
jgi:hypothetical protein